MTIKIVPLRVDLRGPLKKCLQESKRKPSHAKRLPITPLLALVKVTPSFPLRYIDIYRYVKNGKPSYKHLQDTKQKKRGS